MLSTHKVGGIRFIHIGRLTASYSVSKRRVQPAQRDNTIGLGLAALMLGCGLLTALGGLILFGAIGLLATRLWLFVV